MKRNVKKQSYTKQTSNAISETVFFFSPLRNSGWHGESGTLKHIHIVMTSQSFNKPFCWHICLASGNHHNTWCSLAIPYCCICIIINILISWDKFRISLPLTFHLDRLVLRILSRAQLTKSSWIYAFFSLSCVYFLLVNLL